MTPLTDILFDEIFRRLKEKFSGIEVFYSKIQSKRQKCVFFLFTPQGFSHTLVACVQYDQNVRPGSIGYMINRLEHPITEHSLSSDPPEIELAGPYCYPSEHTLDSAFIACIQCEMQLRTGESPKA